MAKKEFEGLPIDSLNKINIKKKKKKKWELSPREGSN